LPAFLRVLTEEINIKLSKVTLVIFSVTSTHLIGYRIRQVVRHVETRSFFHYFIHSFIHSILLRPLCESYCTLLVWWRHHPRNSHMIQITFFLCIWTLRTAVISLYRKSEPSCRGKYLSSL